MTKIVSGIEYTLPQVYLLQDSGLGVAEYAGRTAYDSFDKSENVGITLLNKLHKKDTLHGIEEANLYMATLGLVNQLESSELLTSLAWVHHHHSVLELVNLSFLVKGTSRGYLQEHARHRIQSLTVRSTRYTGSGILNAFVAALDTLGLYAFANLALQLDMFVSTNKEYNVIELECIHNKLEYQYNKIGKEAFLKLTLSKDAHTNGALDLPTPQQRFDALQASKAKRNALDPFKHIVTDNWKVDLVFNMNLRALKNFLDLRTSGAAWFQAQWMAEAVIAATPDKYLKLIRKDMKD